MSILAKRARVHSRDLQPQIVAPKAWFAAARVQRFDWPENIPTTAIDEIGRRLHVGTTQEAPDVTVTIEAFDVSHNTFAYMTGYTPGTFPVSGASITELKNIDVVGQIKDAGTNNELEALYVKRAIVTGMDASFGVTQNSTVTYTVGATSKKEFKAPVFVDYFTVSVSGLVLSHVPNWLPRTSGWTIDAYETTAAGTTHFLDEGVDYNVVGSTATLVGPLNLGGTVWISYASSATTGTFQALDDVAPAAIQGKYVPLTISVSRIPRVQSATIRAAFNAEKIFEMGGLGKPIGYEADIPAVTGDITVLKTDTDLINLLTGQSLTNNAGIEGDLEYALNTLPLKIELKDPANPARVLVTYYIPSVTFTAESDTSQVNQSMQQTFSWESKTGELIVISGASPY